MGGNWSRLEMHQHWRTTDVSEWNDQGPYRSRAFMTQIADVPRDARILDVGCGPGQWLGCLADEGYTNLEGLDMNHGALALIRDRYPSLLAMPFHGGAAEDVLPTLRGPYDLITTRAFLQQLHPDSIEAVCDEIARLTDDLLANEGINVPSGMAYTHDYEALFMSRGMRLVSQVSMWDFPELADDTHIKHNEYFFYRFKA